MGEAGEGFEVFVQVVDSGSVSGAARVLGSPRETVSRQLALSMNTSTMTACAMPAASTRCPSSSVSSPAAAGGVRWLRSSPRAWPNRKTSEATTPS